MSPTYRDLGDHTEAIQIDFDPSVLRYEDLLAIFLEGHDPCGSAWSRQYRSAVFYQDDEQRAAARTAIDEATRGSVKPATTAVEPAGVFTRAEDYHQKYYLRRAKKAAGELEAIYPETRDFVDSTAVARANGFLGGHGEARDLECLGLSQEAADELARRLRR